MASNGKKKTTMAKLNREAKLREKRLDKQARKDARRLAPAEPTYRTLDEFGQPVDEVDGLDRPVEGLVPDDALEPAAPLPERD
jgi:hypothetical protein